MGILEVRGEETGGLPTFFFLTFFQPMQFSSWDALGGAISLTGLDRASTSRASPISVNLPSSTASPSSSTRPHHSLPPPRKQHQQLPDLRPPAQSSLCALNRVRCPHEVDHNPRLRPPDLPRTTLTNGYNSSREGPDPSNDCISPGQGCKPSTHSRMTSPP